MVFERQCRVKCNSEGREFLTHRDAASLQVTRKMVKMFHGSIDALQRSTLPTGHDLITNSVAKAATEDRMCSFLAGLGQELLVQIALHTAECHQHICGFQHHNLRSVNGMM